VNVFVSLGLPRPELREEVANRMMAGDFLGIMKLIERCERESWLAGRDAAAGVAQEYQEAILAEPYRTQAEPWKWMAASLIETGILDLTPPREPSEEKKP
jgi:hypothetical protein